MSEEEELKKYTEDLAKIVHESSRAAVQKGAVINLISRKFIEWEQLPERAKEGRRLQARYLMSVLDIVDYTSPEKVVETSISKCEHEYEQMEQIGCMYVSGCTQKLFVCKKCGKSYEAHSKSFSEH